MSQTDWFEDHNSLVAKRLAVADLTVDNVRELLTASVAAIRHKDLAALKGLLSPKFLMHTYRAYGNTLEPLRLTLGGYMVWASSWFQLFDTSEYSMEIESISIQKQTGAAVVVVSDPGNKELHDLLGSRVRETVNVDLYWDRPVVLSVTVNREGPNGSFDTN